MSHFVPMLLKTNYQDQNILRCQDLNVFALRPKPLILKGKVTLHFLC